MCGPFEVEQSKVVEIEMEKEEVNVLDTVSVGGSKLGDKEEKNEAMGRMQGEPATLEDDFGVGVKLTADSAIRVTVSPVPHECAADACGSSMCIVASTSALAVALGDETS